MNQLIILITEDGKERPMHNIVIDAYNFSLIAAGASKDENLFRTVINNMLRSITHRFLGSRFFAVWDSFGGTSFRKEIDGNYKKNRTTKFIDFEVVNSMKPLFEDYGITNIAIKKNEADDVIYALCKVLSERGETSTIVSRDKDLIQVVQAGYARNQYDPVKKKDIEVPWYSIVDYKSLVGDTSDNISGVKGIGAKTAIKVLLNQYALNEEQKKEFEKSKDIIDITRSPMYESNLNYIQQLLLKLN